MYCLLLLFLPHDLLTRCALLLHFSPWIKIRARSWHLTDGLISEGTARPAGIMPTFLFLVGHRLPGTQEGAQKGHLCTSALTQSLMQILTALGKLIQVLLNIFFYGTSCAVIPLWRETCYCHKKATRYRFSVISPVIDIYNCRERKLPAGSGLRNECQIFLALHCFAIKSACKLWVKIYLFFLWIKFSDINNIDHISKHFHICIE